MLLHGLESSDIWGMEGPCDMAALESKRLSMEPGPEGGGRASAQGGVGGLFSPGS